MRVQRRRNGAEKTVLMHSEDPGDVLQGMVLGKYLKFCT